MAILVLGANGFIGRHVADGLEAAGFAVLRGTRPRYDLSRAIPPAEWRALLEGCDAVVNAAGIFAQSPGQAFDQVHTRGPIALFDACALRGIPVIQVSALGAADTAPTEFLRSKARADAHLLSLAGPSLVLQPSLVFGPGGASARLLATMATMPVVPLPGNGRQSVQPVHVDDLAAAIVAALRRRVFPRARLAAVGPQPMTLREYLSALRRAMRRGPARFLPVPMPLVRGVARLRLGLVDADAIAMLEQGSVADPAPFAALLAREPRAAAAFIGRDAAQSTARDASLGWVLPVLRVALACMWLAAAVVSAGLFPVDESRAMLAQVGLTGLPATLALYGAATLDAILGMATLVVRRRWLWTAQALLVAGYTAIITVFLPAQWLHPFGPVVKNLPILAAILLMREMEAR